MTGGCQLVFDGAVLSLHADAACKHSSRVHLPLSALLLLPPFLPLMGDLAFWTGKSFGCFSWGQQRESRTASKATGGGSGSSSSGSGAGAGAGPAGRPAPGLGGRGHVGRGEGSGARAGGIRSFLGKRSAPAGDSGARPARPVKCMRCQSRVRAALYTPTCSCPLAARALDKTWAIVCVCVFVCVRERACARARERECGCE